MGFFEEKFDCSLLSVWRTMQREGIKGLRRYTARRGVDFLDDKVYLTLGVRASRDLSKDPKWGKMFASGEDLGSRGARIPAERLEELASDPAVTHIRLAIRYRIPVCRGRRRRA